MPNSLGGDLTGSNGINRGLEESITSFLSTVDVSCASFFASSIPSSLGGGGDGVVCSVVVESTGLVAADDPCVDDDLALAPLLLDDGR